MKGHVKLTTAEHRAWRVNKAQWVSSKGVVLRAVTPEEEQAIFPIVERVKRTGKTETLPAVAVYKVRDGRGAIVEHKQPMEVTVRATRTGREANSFLLDVFVGGNRYVKGREIIAKRMLRRHGECILFQPNGKRLMVVRDPKIARPSYVESQRTVPHPDHCGCRAFSDRREPGRHHIACEWNAKAPPHEQATPFSPQVPETLVDSPEPLEALAFDPSVVVPGGVDPFGRTVIRGGRGFVAQPPPELPVRAAGHAARSVPSQVPLAPAAAARRPTLDAPTYVATPEAPVQVETSVTPNPRAGSIEVFSPEQCPEDCRGFTRAEAAWPWPPGRRPLRGHHHPLCPHEGPYQQRFGQGRRWVLYDLIRRTEVREATGEEIARSEVELQRSGTRSVTVAGNIYAVVPTRSRAAAAEAPQVARAAPAAASESVHETARQTALRSSGLPSVPGQGAAPPPPRGPASDPMSELEWLRSRVLELERSAALEAPVGPGVAPGNQPEYGYSQGYAQEPSYLQQPGAPPLPPELQPRPIGSAADHLRNEQGLIGNQQLGDDIPPGEVILDDPEPFVDPLPAMRVANRSAAPAPYHPGVVHTDGFVPPPLPTLEEPVRPVEKMILHPETYDELVELGVMGEAPARAGGPAPDEQDEDSEEEDEESPIAAGPIAALSALEAATAAAATAATLG